MSEHIMEKLTVRPLNDISEKLSKRANEHEVRIGTLSALTERCNRLESENASLRGAVQGLGELCDKYKAENANLRELLHDAAIELYVNGNITDGATELLFDQMRELGIEVPHD